MMTRVSPYKAVSPGPPGWIMLPSNLSRKHDPGVQKGQKHAGAEVEVEETPWHLSPIELP